MGNCLVDTLFAFVSKKSYDFCSQNNYSVANIGAEFENRMLCQNASGDEDTSYEMLTANRYLVEENIRLKRNRDEYKIITSHNKIVHKLNRFKKAWCK